MESEERQDEIREALQRDATGFAARSRAAAGEPQPGPRSLIVWLLTHRGILRALPALTIAVGLALALLGVLKRGAPFIIGGVMIASFGVGGFFFPAIVEKQQALDRLRQDEDRAEWNKWRADNDLPPI